MRWLGADTVFQASDHPAKRFERGDVAARAKDRTDPRDACQGAGDPARADLALIPAPPVTESAPRVEQETRWEDLIEFKETEPLRDPGRPRERQ